MNDPNDLAIEFRDVFEKYEIELTLDGKTTRESFEALRNISFTVRKGEALAIIGPNGAGKSTLLRLIAGLLAPEKGEIKVHGRVGSLLDLGAGFHPELTGRDNLLLNASLYHFSREELEKKYEAILDFAGIGKFINAPVRCYSQGMYVRLAFSLAIHVDPDIVLIDDCLAVGDDGFRLKSVDKVLEMRSRGKTIILVTHDLGLARKVCSRGIYLKESEIVLDGGLDEVADRYLRPAQVDGKQYQYLGPKLLEEEKRQKQEEEGRRRDELNRMKTEAELQRLAEAKQRFEEEKHRKAEEERLRAEEAARLKAIIDETERRRLQDEARLKAENVRRQAEEEKRRFEKEQRKRGLALLCGGSLRALIAPAQIRIFQHDREITSGYGVRTRFRVRGNDLYSDGAIWRVRKVSGQEILCFLRWPKPYALFQVWRFQTAGDGTLNLEIEMRKPATLEIDAGMVEYSLGTVCEVPDRDRFHNKTTVFSCGAAADLKIKTLRDDQVSGFEIENPERCRVYFLTVSDEIQRQSRGRKHSYFKGQFLSGPQAAVAVEKACPVVRALGSGKQKIEFHDGSCQLVWNDRHLTTGLGIYTSLFSQGIWYDSTQARWALKTFSQERLIVRGFWPWLPISQQWEIFWKDRDTISLDITMEIFQKVPIAMQETVLMMNDAYTQWSSGGEIRKFPTESTQDDFFRFCFWSGTADGATGLSCFADPLPAVTFLPAALPAHRIIAENSEHIYNTRSRLFHCLHARKTEGLFLSPGAYNFFKGIIHLKEGKT